jgi:hypothetical protein
MIDPLAISTAPSSKSQRDPNRCVMGPAIMNDKAEIIAGKTWTKPL